MVLEAGSNSAAEAVACVSFYETGFRFRCDLTFCAVIERKMICEMIEDVETLVGR